MNIGQSGLVRTYIQLSGMLIQIMVLGGLVPQIYLASGNRNVIKLGKHVL